MTAQKRFDFEAFLFLKLNSTDATQQKPSFLLPAKKYKAGQNSENYTWTDSSSRNNIWSSFSSTDLNVNIFWYCLSKERQPPIQPHFEARSLRILKHYSPQNITLLKIRKDNKPVSRSGLGLGQLLLVVDEQVQLVAHGLHLQGHRQVHVKFIVKFTVSLFIDKINSTFASTSLILSYNWGLNWALIWLI